MPDYNDAIFRPFHTRSTDHFGLSVQKNVSAMEEN
jgi:hypothetical protein